MMAMKGVHPKIAPKPPHNQNPNDVAVVGRQGHPHRERPPKPKNYLTVSVLVAFFCCFPFGLFGVCKTLDAKEQYERGNYEAAAASSKCALRFAQLGLVGGIMTYVAGISVILVDRFYVDLHSQESV